MRRPAPRSRRAPRAPRLVPCPRHGGAAHRSCQPLPGLDAHAAGPVRGRHRPLAHRPHLAQLHRRTPRCRRAPGASPRAARPGSQLGAARPRAGSTGPRPRRSPRNVVHAPGSGVTERTSRSTATGGRGPVDAGVVDGDLRGVRDAVGRLRAGIERAVLDAVQRGHQQRGTGRRRAGRAGPRRCRWRATGSVTTPNTGPVSRPSSSRNVLAPVISSPCAQRGLHRGRAAPRRQQREVQVDPAVPRHVERRPRDQRAVGDHRAAVRGELARARRGTSGSRRPGGREHRDARPRRRARPPGSAPACGRGRRARPGG